MSFVLVVGSQSFSISVVITYIVYYTWHLPVCSKNFVPNGTVHFPEFWSQLSTTSTLSNLPLNLTSTLSETASISNGRTGRGVLLPILVILCQQETKDNSFDTTLYYIQEELTSLYRYTWKTILFTFQENRLTDEDPSLFNSNYSKSKI